MFRASVYLPKPLHYRLLLAAREARRMVSRLLLYIADHEIQHRDKDYLEHLYAILDQLIGIGPKGIENTSSTIDDV